MKKEYTEVRIIEILKAVIKCWWGLLIGLVLGGLITGLCEKVFIYGLIGAVLGIIFAAIVIGTIYVVTKNKKSNSIEQGEIKCLKD